jgi:integrase/recombinase XerD
MANVKLVLRRHKMTTSGEIPVYIRITHHRKTKFISLGIKVIPDKNWNEETHRVRRNFPNSGRVNNYIAKKLAEAEAISLDLSTKPQGFTSQNIKEEIMGKPSGCYLTFGDKQVERLEQAEQVRTALRYKVVMSKLRKFLKGKPFTFDDFTVSFLYDFEAHLKSIGNGTNTIHTNLKTLRSILYIAIKEDLFPQGKNPFFKFKLKKGATKKNRLTLDEMKKLEKLHLDKSQTIYHVRNFFLFSFYCAGLRVGDGVQLKWSNLSGNRLTYVMSKTGLERTINLISLAQIMIEEYKTDQVKPTDFIFPFLSNQEDLSKKKTLVARLSGRTTKINQHLKAIALKAGIDKKLTSHVARHSFAEIARTKGVPIYDISKALGHSSLAITEQYLSSFDENSLQNAMDKIFC